MWSKGQQEQHSRNQDRQKVPGQRLVDLKLLDARRRRTLHHSRKAVSVHSANGKEPVCHSRSYIPQEIAVKHLASSIPASPVKHTCVSPNTQCSSYAQTTNPIQINVLPRQIRHRWLCRSRSCSHQEISDKKLTNRFEKPQWMGSNVLLKRKSLLPTCEAGCLRIPLLPLGNTRGVLMLSLSSSLSALSLAGGEMLPMLP